MQLAELTLERAERSDVPAADIVVLFLARIGTEEHHDSVLRGKSRQERASLQERILC